jgi:ketosteroid isomerase-like protein
MLVCKNCNIEYEEGKKFCKHCGDPLAPKAEPMSTQKKVNKAEEENSDGKLICPNCKIVYEFGSSCIQCGAALGRQGPPEAKEEPKTALKTESEEKLPPVQTSPKQQMGAPREKLICPNCKIIYESGSSCIKCESALVPQTPSQANEEPKISRGLEVEGEPLQVQTIQEQLVQTPRKKLICPTCKIIYERGDSCVRCGSGLVSQTEFQEKEKPKSSDTEVSLSALDLGVGTGPARPAQEDVDFEWPSLTSPKRRDSGAAEKGKKKEFEVFPTMEVEEDFFKTQTSKQQPPKTSADDSEKRSSLPTKPKKDYRRLFLEVGGITIMALAGGYFLWSVYSNLIRKEPERRTLVSKGAVSQILPASSSSANPAATGTESGESKTKEESSSISKEAAPSPLSPPDTSKTPSAEIQERRNIETLLENIRRANLQKDIDLFISCYAADFKDREGKKRATLSYWTKFDYVDLSYDLKNSSISGDTAKVKVEWVITTSSKTGKQPQKSKAILNVTLKKEEGGWKIEEVKQAG